jgi:hypothetical protein
MSTASGGFKARATAASRCTQVCSALVAFVQAQPPIIVKIIPPKAKSDLEGLSDVLLGSIGLTGLITLAALLLGAVLAGVMFWIRSRATTGDSENAEGGHLGI